jgi:hypothetical protein
VLFDFNNLQPNAESPPTYPIRVSK